MTGIRTTVVLLLVVGLVTPAGALGAPAASHGTHGALGDEQFVTATAATAVRNDTSNNSSVSVGVGQQLSTVIAASESDVGAEVEESAFEASIEGADERERAEAVLERATAVRERAADIREDYREATRTYENGELSRSEYAQRLAVLNARAKRVLAAADHLERRAANVSELELATVGLNRTALRRSVADLDELTGTGPAALLERFTGQRRGEVAIERADGLSITVEGEDGERSREVERVRDDDQSISVEQSAALETARGVLSEQAGNWTLQRASVHTDSGYYRFRFGLVTENETGEAEVRVDGSTGEVFRIEEEIERRDDDERDRNDDGEAERDDDADGDSAVDDLALYVSHGTPAPNTTVTLRAEASGEPLANVTVREDGVPVGETGPDGTIEVTLPAGSTTYTVVAREEDAELEFEFERADDERDRSGIYRNLETSATYDGGTVSLRVGYDGSGVANVTVYANDRRVGTTDESGRLTFTTDATEEVDLELVRGELEAELQYRIVDGSLVLAEGVSEGDGDDTSDEGTDEREDDVEDLRLAVVDGQPARGATVTVRVTAGGAPVSNATVAVNGADVGRTDADGRLTVTLPDASEIRVTARAGGDDESLEFEFEERDDEGETGTETPEGTETSDSDDGLTLSVVAGDPAPGATITVEVTDDGEPVPGASVSVEGDAVGETGNDGTIRVTLPEDEDDPRVRAETDDASGRLEFDFDS